MTREEKLNITADRFKDYNGYYIQLAEAVGICWLDGQQKFMGHNLNYWMERYEEDENLNTHPLREFDSYYPSHRLYAAPKAGSWSLCDTVCCLKAVIRQKIMEENI